MSKALSEVWSPVEREAWQMPSEITVSGWADAHRVLDEFTCAEPGPWKTSRTPYLKAIMDAFSNPLVEKITFMKPTQVGGTEALYNMLAYAIDQDPGPTMLVMPKDEDLGQTAENRLKPMIKKSPSLEQHLTGRADDLTKERFRFDRMVLYFGSAGSPSDLASRPIRYLLFDETDKYPLFSGREADPIKLGTERTATFVYNKKIVNASTPTTKDGYIWREYEKSNKLRFHVPCPHCGKYQLLVFDQIKFPETERDAARIRIFKLAYYECRFCQGKIIDAMKMAMLQRGVWATEDAVIEIDGHLKTKFPESSHYGFWINAIYSPWRTFSDIAAEFLDTKENPNELMNFVNSWLAEIWEEKVQETKKETLVRLQMPYPMGVVPEGVIVLTAGVDVQLDHFYLIIDGWGYHQESWRIRAAKVETWTEVEEALFTTAYSSVHGGEPYMVRLSCVDSQYRTSEVHEFVRKWKEKARAIQGHDFLTGAPYKVSHLERNAKNGKPIPRGLALWHLDTNYFKDKVTRLVNTEPGTPGGWHLPNDIPETYLTQFCNEHKVFDKTRRGGQRMIWKKKGTGVRVDYWDCEVYALAAAEMLRVYALRPDGQTSVYQPSRVQGETKNFIGHQSSGWNRQGGSWIRRGK